jgi:hypothetical protein
MERVHAFETLGLYVHVHPHGVTIEVQYRHNDKVFCCIMVFANFVSLVLARVHWHLASEETAHIEKLVGIERHR